MLKETAAPTTTTTTFKWVLQTDMKYATSTAMVRANDANWKWATRMRVVTQTLTGKKGRKVKTQKCLSIAFLHKKPPAHGPLCKNQTQRDPPNACLILLKDLVTAGLGGDTYSFSFLHPDVHNDEVTIKVRKLTAAEVAALVAPFRFMSHEITVDIKHTEPAPGEEDAEDSEGGSGSNDDSDSDGDSVSDGDGEAGGLASKH